VKSIAVAIFVKTPGLSPLKTRLARGIGSTEAEKFHLLSAAIAEEVVGETHLLYPELRPYWAVAEEFGLDYAAWQSFERLLQIPGGLGEKMADVYNGLLEENDAVILLGADCPGLSVEVVSAAIAILKRSSTTDFVAGPAADGGFYLFGGSQKISKELWSSVPYSDSHTLEKLSKAIKEIADVKLLPKLEDIDSVEDLRAFLDKHSDSKKLLKSQKALLEYFASSF